MAKRHIDNIITHGESSYETAEIRPLFRLP